MGRASHGGGGVVDLPCRGRVVVMLTPALEVSHVKGIILLFNAAGAGASTSDLHWWPYAT